MNTNELKIKADSLSLQFISKTAQVIVQSRVIGIGSKRNKWFNLELDDYDQLREELKFWKGQLSSTSTPPLILQIYADISKLKPTDTLLLTNSKTGRRTRIHNNDLIFLDHNKIERRKDKILLETWQLSLS